jgi:hypothetical protein
LIAVDADATMTGLDRATLVSRLHWGSRRALKPAQGVRTKLVRGVLRAAAGVAPYKNLDSVGWQ